MARGILAVGRCIFVACNSAGLQIYENLVYGVEEQPAVPGPAYRIRLAHNPVGTSEVELAVSSPRAEVARLTVSNAVGQTLFALPQLSLRPDPDVLRIPLTRLPVGACFVTIRTSTNTTNLKSVALRQ